MAEETPKSPELVASPLVPEGTLYFAADDVAYALVDLYTARFFGRINESEFTGRANRILEDKAKRTGMITNIKAGNS
jgi:hypothetical protein